jgi:hypothetical protein
MQVYSRWSIVDGLLIPGGKQVLPKKSRASTPPVKVSHLSKLSTIISKIVPNT